MWGRLQSAMRALPAAGTPSSHPPASRMPPCSDVGVGWHEGVESDVGQTLVYYACAASHGDPALLPSASHTAACPSRCEVSERAMHRSLPHGPCKPSARVTGRVRTYMTDLPKQDSTLPESASERDQRSPHIRIISPAIRARTCTIVTRIGPVHHDPRVLDLRRDLLHPTNRRSHGLRSSLLGVHQQYDRSPRVRPSLVSVLRRSPTPDGPTTCLMPTHRTRQKIS
jgi:hypothetical protein